MRFILYIGIAGLLCVSVTECLSDKQTPSSAHVVELIVPPASNASNSAQQITTSPTISALPSLPPVDVTRDNAELRAFVKRIIGYTRKRQLQQLLAVADDGIVISYGGGVYGKQEFKAYLNATESDGYAQIRRALELGGALDSPDPESGKTGSWYCFPYCQSTLLCEKELQGIDMDPYETYIGLTPQVSIYEKPDKHSRVVATLAYPVLFFDEDRAQVYAKKGWFALKTRDGKIQGSVEAEAVYNAADMKLLIVQKQGAFKIMSVASFD